VKLNLLILSSFIPLICLSQDITYSESGYPISAIAAFKIIGKINENFLVYNYIQDKTVISVYNNKMKLLSSQEIEFFKVKNTVSVDLVAYSTFFMIIFQTIENNTFYCKAAKINDTGKLIDEVKMVDSMPAEMMQGTGLYLVTTSENKKFILLNRPLWGLEEHKLQMDQITLDVDLTIKKKDHYFIPFLLNRQFISNASIDNQGNVLFMTWGVLNGNKSNLVIYKSPALEPDLVIRYLTINKYGLKDPQIKIDNRKNNYYVTSFLRTIKKHHIKGLLSLVVKPDLSDYLKPEVALLSEQDIKLANKKISVYQSINNYSLGDFYLKKDGSYVITATLNRGISNISDYQQKVGTARKNALENEPVARPNEKHPFLFKLAESQVPVNYRGTAPLSPLKANVMTFSFDQGNHLADVNSLSIFLPQADLTYYSTAIIGNQVLFLFNNVDNKNRRYLNNFSVFHDGSTMLNLSFKNLDNACLFLPDMGQQVEEKAFIIPCIKNDRLLMAEITFE